MDGDGDDGWVMGGGYGVGGLGGALEGVGDWEWGWVGGCGVLWLGGAWVGGNVGCCGGWMGGR